MLGSTVVAVKKPQLWSTCSCTEHSAGPSKITIEHLSGFCSSDTTNKYSNTTPAGHKVTLPGQPIKADHWLQKASHVGDSDTTRSCRAQTGSLTRLVMLTSCSLTHMQQNHLRLTRGMNHRATKQHPLAAYLSKEGCNSVAKSPPAYKVAWSAGHKSAPCLSTRLHVLKMYYYHTPFSDGSVKNVQHVKANANLDTASGSNSLDGKTLNKAKPDAL